MELDVIVIGGGPAGLSAATTLARARRRVLVVDAGEPRNAPADAVHSFLSHDGSRPASCWPGDGPSWGAMEEPFGRDVRSRRA